ncbi:hypothetical protein PflCFBP13510_08705 [Pseudomonas fluorescens]|nr:hypothetical protein PflCFBP13510_08705 [Pseudomonas fluorescens]
MAQRCGIAPGAGCACRHLTTVGFFVGASLLAKNSQAPRLLRKHALSLTFFASKLAPTVGFAAPSYIETKKKLAINAIPTAHTSERKIAQSAR